MLLMGVLLFRLCLNSGFIFATESIFSKVYSLIPLVIAIFIGIVAYRERKILAGGALAILFFVGLCMLLSLISLPAFGSFQTAWLNFAFYFLIAGLSILNKKQWEIVVQTVALVFLFLIFAKLAVNYDDLLYFFDNPDLGHPILETYFVGGVNLEATWMGMFGVFFYRNKRGYFYLISCLAIASLYGSRAGLIACFLSTLYVLFVKDSKNAGTKVLLVSVAAMVFFALLLVVMSAMDIAVFERFLSIGEEPGSMGRINMWAYVGNVLDSIPIYGVGAGNTMNEIALLSGRSFYEDNIHNVYLQILIDFGPISFFFVLCLVGILVWRMLGERFQNPFSVFMAIYFILALIQFTGPEPLLAVVCGGYLSAGLEARRKGTPRLVRGLAPRQFGDNANGAAAESVSEVDCA